MIIIMKIIQLTEHKNITWSFLSTRLFAINHAEQLFKLVLNLSRGSSLNLLVSSIIGSNSNSLGTFIYNIKHSV